MSGTTKLALALLSAAAFAPAAAAQGYGGYPSWYWGYSWDPYGGYLHGAAAVINAQGQYAINFQQGRLVKEQVRSAKIDNRRKEIEQWLWERENLPTTEDERVRAQMEQLKRVRNDPPLTEIWSGRALNDLLIDVQKSQSFFEIPNSPPLEERLVAKLNATTGKREGNIGMLRNTKLNWPLLLRRPAFNEDREQIETSVKRSVEQGAKGDMDAEAVEDILRLMNRLHKKLVTMVREAGDEANFTPTMYIDAKTFLANLNDAVKVLQQPDAVDFLTGRQAAQGKTVAELVKHMTTNGLRFAPATPGGEWAYTALHRMLANYDVKEGTQLTPRTKP